VGPNKEHEKGRIDLDLLGEWSGLFMIGLLRKPGIHRLEVEELLERVDR
jgi:hypothetical protein